MTEPTKKVNEPGVVKLTPEAIQASLDRLRQSLPRQFVTNVTPLPPWQWLLYRDWLCTKV